MKAEPHTEVSATGLNNVNNGIEVEPDAPTHQLRLYGPVSVDEMQSPDARGPYETLLSSRL